MFWLLKRTVSSRRFFWVPPTYVLVEKQEFFSKTHSYLTSWLSFVMSNCEVVTFPLVFWVRCGGWLYQFLIFALFLTLPKWTYISNRFNTSYWLFHNYTVFFLRWIWLDFERRLKDPRQTSSLWWFNNISWTTVFLILKHFKRDSGHGWLLLRLIIYQKWYATSWHCWNNNMGESFFLKKNPKSWT